MDRIEPVFILAFILVEVVVGLGICFVICNDVLLGGWAQMMLEIHRLIVHLIVLDVLVEVL